MGRTARERRTPYVPKVEKVELSEKNVGFRLVLVVILLAVGLTAIGYGINSIFTTQTGWQEIHADSRGAVNCSEEFVLLYQLGVNGASATAENKALTMLYTEVCEKAYQLFHTKQAFESINNVYYVNQHPNEEIVVDEVLYQALEQIQKQKSRYLYLAPVYVRYDDIFACTDDSQLVDFDPYMNSEIAKEYAEVVSYALDEASVDIKLLGNNKVMLYVSEEYLAYAEANYITDFIDFAWMKNAFITDYLADSLLEKGYTRGSISSYDGFVRNLDDSGNSYSLNLFHRFDGKVYQVATLEYAGARSFVNMRSFPVNVADENHYYELQNGEIRNAYLDVMDGCCKSAADTMISYAKDKSCAEIALGMAPIYIADTLAADKIWALAAEGIHSVYCTDGIITYTEETLILKDIYDVNGVSYIKHYLGK